MLITTRQLLELVANNGDIELSRQLVIAANNGFDKVTKICLSNGGQIMTVFHKQPVPPPKGGPEGDGDPYPKHTSPPPPPRK